MDIKKLVHHRSSRRKARKGDTAQLAAQLAPLEEQAVPVKGGIESSSGNGQADPNFAAITVDRDPSLVPKDMLEEGGAKTFLGMEPVVLVILGVMIAFIIFIAWQISQMPAK